MNNEILKNYMNDVVDNFTPPPSKNINELLNVMESLNDTEGVNIPRLLTSSMGMSAESGEFMEIVKKMLFQGKPLDDETKFHMIREMGDILWYWSQGCLALGVDPTEIIEENGKKLFARYDNGKFEVEKSENRKDGDI